MKSRYFILAVLMCVCVAVTGRAYAQGPLTATKTTLTNADTSYFSAGISGPANFVSLQMNITKVSGTVAGNIVIQCSEDAVMWSTATDTAHAAVVTYTVTDGTQTKRWELGPQRARYYRARLITSGTQVCTGKGFYWGK